MFILASASPRRKELLKQIVEDFIVLSADIDENIEVDNLEELPCILSLLKAQKIQQKYPDATILAADTIVISDGKLFGKPLNQEDARRMLNELSNKSHQVITGYTLIKNSQTITRKVITIVEFNCLTAEMINAYVSTGSPLDKAGGYGIQDHQFALVKKISGSYTNVMGLPVENIINDL